MKRPAPETPSRPTLATTPEAPVKKQKLISPARNLRPICLDFAEHVNDPLSGAPMETLARVVENISECIALQSNQLHRINNLVEILSSQIDDMQREQDQVIDNFLAGEQRLWETIRDMQRRLNNEH